MTIYLCPKCSGIMRPPAEIIHSGEGKLPERYICAKCGYDESAMYLARNSHGHLTDLGES